MPRQCAPDGLRRKDAERLRQLAASPDATLVPVSAGRSLVCGEGAAVVPLAAAQGLLTPGTLTFLGLRPGDGAAVFAAECEQRVDELARPAGQARHAAAPAPTLAAGRRGAARAGAGAQARWANLRREGPGCEAGAAALMALAAGLVGWHAANGFCGATGRPLRALQGGHARRAGPAAGPAAGPGPGAARVCVPAGAHGRRRGRTGRGAGGRVAAGSPDCCRRRARGAPDRPAGLPARWWPVGPAHGGYGAPARPHSSSPPRRAANLPTCA